MNIIGIAGRKQAGKNTVANYINGEVLLARQMIKSFYIDEHGKLIVETDDESGATGFGELDVTRKDSAFIEYANQELWPYIKIYHFADYLKNMSINVFGFSPKQVYGNDSDKNTHVDILWESMPWNLENKSGKMTSREFLQHFGTNIVRKICDNAWVNATMKLIQAESPKIAIIPDVRFPNEAEAIKNAGGKVIRLTRDIFHSDHESEKALDKDCFDWNKFDIIIDNQNMTIDDLCETIKSYAFTRVI